MWDFKAPMHRVWIQQSWAPLVPPCFLPSAHVLPTLCPTPLSTALEFLPTHLSLLPGGLGDCWAAEYQHSTRASKGSCNTELALGPANVLYGMLATPTAGGALAEWVQNLVLNECKCKVTLHFSNVGSCFPKFAQSVFCLEVECFSMWLSVQVFQKYS